MPFVSRNKAGIIVGVFNIRQAPNQEFINDNDISPHDIHNCDLRIMEPYEVAFKSHLNAEARFAGYFDITEAMSYNGTSNEYQKESEKFIKWAAKCKAVYVKQRETLSAADHDHDHTIKPKDVAKTVKKFITTLPARDPGRKVKDKKRFQKLKAIQKIV